MTWVKDTTAIFEEMTREELIAVARTMHQSIGELQAEGSRLVNELRGHRAYIGVYADPNCTLSGTMGTSGFSAAINDLIGVRFSSDCKHGTAADQVGMPDGTGEEFTYLVHQWRQCVADGKESNYLEWHDILMCEVAEALAEYEPARLRAELLDVANVALKWHEAIGLRQAKESK